MTLSDIQITRVIAHEVMRTSMLKDHQPLMSEDLVTLDAKGKELVSKRLVDTLSSGSHCIDVTVDNSGAGSPFQKSADMLDAEDKAFIQFSKELAAMLTNAQTSGAIKSGSAIFVQGTCALDDTDTRFLAIIKADSDQGLRRAVKGGNITLTHVSDMLLGGSQKLFKVAFFAEESPADDTSGGRTPEEFSVKVYDHLLQPGGEGEAASYFYKTFLQCTQSPSAARETKAFFEFVADFIDTMDMPKQEKVQYHGDLVSYIRGNRATLEPRTFAKEVLPAKHQDAFVKKCREEGFTQAISKDTTLLKGRMKKQSVRFSSNVTLYAPPEVLRDSVKIGATSDKGWTTIEIKGTVEAML